jgi:ferric-dicitrate binding protein FerR (iron transport regulator)
MSDQQDILFPGNTEGKKLSEEKLQAYADGALSPADQHEVELWLANEGMEGDAIEGLRTLNAGEIKHSVGRINHRLQKNILKKKWRRRPLNTGQLTWVAVIVILLLVILAFIIVRKAL